MAEHRFGNWTLGIRGGSVVSDTPTITEQNTGHSDVDYYGGYLVAESIATPEFARLIAAAPKMLGALEAALRAEAAEKAWNCDLSIVDAMMEEDGLDMDHEEYVQHTREFAFEMAQTAIAKARGEETEVTP